MCDDLCRIRCGDRRIIHWRYQFRWLAPHAALLLAGPRHARSLLVSMATGALLMAFADLVGRSIIAPFELPAGSITAVIGAPAFVLVLHSRKRKPAS